MRLRPELPLIALCLLLFASAPAFAAGDAPTQQQIDHAVEIVKRDPNLSSEKTVRTLTWHSSDDEDDKPNTPSSWPDWLSWIPNLFMWIGQASQMLVWLLLAGLAGMLLLFIFRLVRDTRLDAKVARFVAPTHVQDLDIRPESLPPDIGASARALWDRGEHRAALALLYRGMLSRLAHVHEVAIRDSSTEGDCLTLAARKLDLVRVAYVTQLVRTWQRFTYGGIAIETPLVHELCAAFAANLDATAATGTSDGARHAGAGA